MPTVASKTWGLRPPKPLSPPNTGDTRVDEAIAAARLYKATSRHDKLIANAGQRIVALLDDDALDAGVDRVTDGVLAKLGSQKRAYNKLSAEIGRERQIRKRYLDALMAAIAAVPEGRTRLLEVAAGDHATDLRWQAAWEIVRTGDREGLAEVATTLHPARWAGKGDAERVYREGADAWFRLGTEIAFDELAPLVSATHRATPAGLARARCVVHCLTIHDQGDYGRDDASIRHPPLDPRWAPVIAPMIDDDEVDFVVTFALLALPPEPSALAPFLKTLGKAPDRVSYISDTDARLLAHLAAPGEPSVVPWLLRALQTNADAAPVALDGLRKACAPGAAPAIEAWAKKARKPEHAKLARKVAAGLAKLGPATGGLDLGPTRSILVYQKPPRPPKRRALATLAKQWRAVTTRFAKHGLPARERDVAVEGVVLRTHRGDDRRLAVGATKIGGLPDLPGGATWPRTGKDPLAFVAQIDLAAIARLIDSPLPARGLLSFFIANTVGGPYLETCCVLHTPTTAKLVRTDVPDDYQGEIFQACAIKPHAVVKLPGRESARMSRTLKRAKERDAYATQVYEYVDPEPQLLGARDHDCDNETGTDELLLFQITSDDQAGMTWGDADIVSFLIKTKALASGNFSRVRTCLTE